MGNINYIIRTVPVYIRLYGAYINIVLAIFFIEANFPSLSFGHEHIFLTTGALHNKQHPEDPKLIIQSNYSDMGCCNSIHKCLCVCVYVYV